MLFYSHDAVGLGQLRRANALATALLERLPEALCLIVSGSLETHTFPTPRNIDFVKLPAVTRAALYTGLPSDPTRSGVGGFFGVREAVLCRAFEAFAPDLICVDSAPAGLHGELCRALNQALTARPRPRLVLFAPDTAEALRWPADESLALAEQCYDDILFFEDAPRDTGVMIGLSPQLLQRARWFGALRASEPATAPTVLRERYGVAPDQTVVVLTAGGGEAGAPLYGAWLDALAAGLPPLAGVATWLVAGPLLDAPSRARLSAQSATLPDVTLLHVVDDLPGHLAAADLVITHGGYNTLVEAGSLGRRLLVVPGADACQQARMARLAESGHAICLLPDEVTPSRLAEVALQVLTQPAPQSAWAADGAARAAEWLATEVASVLRQPSQPIVTPPAVPSACRLRPPLTASDDSSEPSCRIVLYSHDGYGLGHTAINMKIANELARRLPDAAILLLSSAMTAHAHELSPRIDYVRLPTVGKEDLFRALPATGATPRGLQGYFRLREALAHEALDTFAPDLFWVDDSPTGIGGDLTCALACLRGADPPVALVFGVKEISNETHIVQRELRAHGAYTLLDEVYDRILIYSDPRFYDSLAHFGFGSAARAKARYCGFLMPEVAHTFGDVRAQLGLVDQPLIVVTAGGGGDGDALVRATLAALREPQLAGAAAFIVTGPLLPAAEVAELRALAAALPSVTLVPFARDLLAYIDAADLVITMGGLTVYEILQQRKRMLIAPRVKWWAEQRMRAERLAELGLARMLLPDELSGANVAREAAALLAGPPPQADFNFDGVRNVCDELQTLLGPALARRH